MEVKNSNIQVIKDRIVAMLNEHEQIPTPSILMDDELMEHAKGEAVMTFPIYQRPSNILICWGLSPLGLEAIHQLWKNKTVDLIPASLMEVLNMPGIFLDIPMAPEIKVYESRHWYPFILARGEKYSYHI